MTKKVITLFLFIAMIFIGSVCAYSFDKKPGSITMSEEPEFSHVKITTIGSAEGLEPVLPCLYGVCEKWKKSEGSFLLQGVGFVIKDGYIVTAAHVVHPTHITIDINKYSRYISKIIKVLSRSIIITADNGLDRIEYGTYAEIYYLDIEHDIAILKFKSNSIYDPISYKLTRTKVRRRGGWVDAYSLLQPGNSVAIITRCRDKDGKWTVGFEIRYGKIISKGIEGLLKDKTPAFSMNDFTIDIIIYPGDSGSAVFAFLVGEPVIVGVVIATNDIPSPLGNIPSKEGFRSYATRIDFVKKILESE